jgi:hypothetical protein
MSDFLKGNFEVRNPVKNELAEGTDKDSEQTLAERLRKAALASIGGSMVYMERTELTWNGDDK